MKKIIITIAAIAAIALVIFFILKKGKKDEITVNPGQMVSLQTMAELCTTEIMAEVPVRDTINSKEIFAIQKQRGQITFNLEKITIDPTADTIRIVLPPAQITLNESTDRNAWEVVDTKAVGRNALFRSDKFTVEEENAAKARAKKKTIALLRRNGTVRRAEEDAAQSLKTFLETLYRKPVEITQDK